MILGKSYLGSTEITKAYLGSNVVYESIVGYDADAQLFITAVATLTTAQEVAINDLVLGLKANGTWDSYKAIYPFIGGTASAHKWNLKNPLDTDAAFRLTFTGTWTHDGNGITGDGSSTYANTNINPSINLALSDAHASIYIRTTGALSNRADLSAYISSTSRLTLYGTSFGSTFGIMWDNSDGFIEANTDPIGNWMISRTSNTDFRIFEDGSQLYTTITTNTGSLPNTDLLIGALSSSLNNVSDKNYAFSTIGNGLTTAEVAADYIIIDAYQTALSRNI